MPISRRRTLAIIGGGTIVAATASAGTFLGTRTPTRALAPWGRAGTYDDPRMNALSHAILAPNPHNRQPWLVDLREPDRVVLYRDKERGLEHTDPYARQLTIGLGCFLELMRIAASKQGYAVDLDLFPEGEEGPVAIGEFRPAGASPDVLFDHVANRRSCKEPFEDKPVSDADARRLSSHATIHRAPGIVDQIRTLTWDAWLTEMSTFRTLKESVDLMRIGKAEINANPDGIDLGGPFLETLSLVGLLSREAQLDPTSSGFREGIKIYQKMLLATHAYAVITTPGNARRDQIAAGMDWLRLNLLTTSLGLSLHPVSQALQEFPEMRQHHARAHELLAEPGGTVQMLGRLGHGPRVEPSPRWPLETRILNG